METDVEYEATDMGSDSTGREHDLSSNITDLSESTIEQIKEQISGTSDLPDSSNCKLSQAILDKNTNLALCLINGNSYVCLNEWDKHGFQPIHYAKLTGNTEVLEALVMQGADPTNVSRNEHRIIVENRDFTCDHVRDIYRQKFKSKYPVNLPALLSMIVDPLNHAKMLAHKKKT